MNREIVYGVPCIEKRGGKEKRLGFCLYRNKDKCLRQTHRAAKAGRNSEGYIGPVQPLFYVEIPYISLPEEMKRKIRIMGYCATPNEWVPEFKSERISIGPYWEKNEINS